MFVNGLWVGLLAIIFGILIMVFPDLLRWLVGVFLIIYGLLALFRSQSRGRRR